VPTRTTAIDVNQDLLDVAQQLVGEYDDLTAGSVLRCYARAVRRGARAGCPAHDLAREAGVLARHMLANRRQAGRVRLPAQPGAAQSGAITERGWGAA
jgi:hypothetical protein